MALFNSSHDVELLAAMDALGLMRQVSAVASLTERYQFYRQANKRALAGGALEALARIGDPSSQAIVQAVITDKWGEGRDATALAVAFARERLLKDGSIAIIREAARRSFAPCAGAAVTLPSSVSPLRDSAGLTSTDAPRSKSRAT